MPSLENLIAAAMPGGIEAQEARGQKVFVNSETLPIETGSCTREQLEKMGIVFGQPVDDLFVSVTLPEGWGKVPTPHSMWSKLVDAKGRERASIFYKAAFYDRSARINLVPRFSAQCMPEGGYEDRGCEGAKADRWYGVVLDSGNEIFRTDGHTSGDNYERLEELRRDALAWLQKNYPEHEDPLAYWDQA